MAKLYFRYGAMDCGKTVQLLQVAHNYEDHGQKVCIIKPATDTKNGTKLLSRVGNLERETHFTFDHKVDLYEKLKSEYPNVDCVLVDEAQFLTPAQADELSHVAAILDIPVICYGLRVNFRQQSGGFEGSTRLLQIAEDLQEIKTICDCGRKATRSCRFLDGKLVVEGPDILIDDGKTKVEYRPICSKCYYEKIAKSHPDQNNRKS